jgi:hypothetical protein
MSIWQVREVFRSSTKKAELESQSAAAPGKPEAAALHCSD